MERQAVAKVEKMRTGNHHFQRQSARTSSAAHSLLQLQRSIGNEAIQRLTGSPFIQAKLQISTPEDESEQEADRVADSVMRMPEPRIAAKSKSHIPSAIREDDDDEKVPVQRVCTKCEEEHVVKRKDMSAGAQHTASPPVLNSTTRNIQALSGGSPLSNTSRAFFEPRFGSDLNAVRVHTDSRAAETAKAINAKAFTIGNNIAFGAGQYQPHSQNGQRLLAHELTHVVQQSGNGMSQVAGRKISRAEASVQRDLLDDFTGELTNLKENIVAGVEQAGSAVASGVEAAGSAVASGAEAVGAAVTSGAQAVSSAVSSGAKTVAGTVDSAKEQAAAIAGMANENTEEALDEIVNWRNLQVNWDSEEGRTIRAWAARLDPEIVRRVRNISPSTLFSVVSVPDEVRQAAELLARQSRADFFKPGLRPLIDPRVIPSRPLPPGIPVKAPVIIIVIIIILAILLTPTNTFDEKGFEDKELEKGREEERKRRAEEEKEKKEKEKGRCRETIPGLRAQIHIKTIEELDKNADDFINKNFKGENNADDLGFFFNKEKFGFFRSIVQQTKNTILKVCSVPNDTLATSSGNKHIRDKLHAEELAAPFLITQLQSVPLVEREGATLFNVCQSRACVREVVTNPEGCTAVLEGIRDRFLPGGQVLDEPTGFPPDAILIPKSSEALLRQLKRRLPN